MIDSETTIKDLNYFKKELSNIIFNLLEDDWFKDLKFYAHDEVRDFRDSVEKIVEEYLYDVEISPIFSIKLFKHLLCNSIYEQVRDEIEYLFDEEIGKVSVENGKWVFPKKSWTTRSVSKKIAIFITKEHLEVDLY
jgi:hypothetical protein